jgi:hypothetical protein
VLHESYFYLVPKEIDWQKQDVVIELARCDGNLEVFAFIDGRWKTVFYSLSANGDINIISEKPGPELETALVPFNSQSLEPGVGVKILDQAELMNLPMTQYSDRLPRKISELDLDSWNILADARTVAEFWSTEALGFDSPTTFAHIEHMLEVLDRMRLSGFDFWEVDFTRSLTLLADCMSRLSPFKLAGIDLQKMGFSRDFAWWVDDATYAVEKFETEEPRDYGVSMSKREDMNAFGWAVLAATLAIRCVELKNARRKNPRNSNLQIAIFKSRLESLNVPLLLYKFLMTEIGDYKI